MVLPFDSVAMYLPSGQQTPVSICGSAVTFFYSRDLFHGVNWMAVSVSFIHNSDPCCLRWKTRIKPLNCVFILIYGVQNNSLHYRTLAYRSLVTLEVKQKKISTATYVKVLMKFRQYWSITKFLNALFFY